jgi:hypothetical protein
VPTFLLCAVCGKIARPHKIVRGRTDPAIVGGRTWHSARVCATGDCEERWRATWDDSPKAAPDAP